MLLNDTWFGVTEVAVSRSTSARDVGWTQSRFANSSISGGRPMVDGSRGLAFKRETPFLPPPVRQTCDGRDSLLA